jgi:hypothetical protein
MIIKTITCANLTFESDNLISAACFIKKHGANELSTRSSEHLVAYLQCKHTRHVEPFVLYVNFCSIQYAHPDDRLDNH